MCYVGKATKIFIFLVTVILITALIFGLGILRHSIHPKSHRCTHYTSSCSPSNFFPPPPPPPFPLDFPIPTTPDLPPPPPPPPAAVASPPPSGSRTSQPPPSPPPPVVVVNTKAPPPLVVILAPPPSPVPVTPGPVNSS